MLPNGLELLFAPAEPKMLPLDPAPLVPLAWPNENWLLLLPAMVTIVEDGPHPITNLSPKLLLHDGLRSSAGLDFTRS